MTTKSATQGMRQLFGLGASPADLQRQMQALQQSTEEATRSARQNPMNDGVRVDKVVLNGTPGGASASVEIVHKLGREPLAFFVVNHRAGKPATYKTLEKTAKRIVVSTTSSSTVDLWVY